MEIFEVLALFEESVLRQKTITLSIRAIAHLVTELDRVAVSEGQISYALLSQLKKLMQQGETQKIKFAW